MAFEIGFALTPKNLVTIGAIDSFYDCYISVRKIYESKQDEFFQTYENEAWLHSDAWDNLCKKEVRKACEPVINQYLHIFTDEYTHIYANAYGFQSFRFITAKQSNGPLTLQICLMSFDDFLSQLQLAVARIIYNRRLKIKPKYLFWNLYEEVNKHILSYVREHTIVKEISDNESIPITNDVLYIYDTLSSTACYTHNHPVIDACYIANFATMSGKISLPVHYCKICKKYFIGRTTLALFEKNFGKLIIQRKKFQEEEDAFSAFNIESYLHQLGYNVSDGRTDNERQAYLVKLLQNDLITYLDMVRCIELNIQIHSNKPIAVTKWKRDLKFIGDYIVEKNT